MTFSAETRAWLIRVAISLLAAAVAGALAYLLARAAGRAYLLYQQQQAFRELGGLLGGGIEGLASSNLRQARLLIAQLDARYSRISAQIGVIAACIVAIISYLWLERRAAK